MWISSVHFYEDDISSGLERIQRISRGEEGQTQQFLVRAPSKTSFFASYVSLSF